MDFVTIITPVIIVGAIAVIIGLGLAIASKFLAVPVDERIEKVRDCLPGANCGACGYSGCDDYAKAVCEGAETNKCIPGGEATVSAINDILGTSSTAADKRVAVVACRGTHTNTTDKMSYKGDKTCRAATVISSGQRTCSFACLGFGDCKAACPYDAICLVDGVAVINSDICVGCGVCVRTCPKNLISLVNADESVIVTCKNQNKGPVSAKVCKVSCIACKKCEKTCPHDAIHVVNNIAIVNQKKCTRCGACVEVCPRKCISFLKDTNISNEQK